MQRMFRSFEKNGCPTLLFSSWNPPFIVYLCSLIMYFLSSCFPFLRPCHSSFYSFISRRHPLFCLRPFPSYSFPRVTTLSSSPFLVFSYRQLKWENLEILSALRQTTAFKTDVPVTFTQKLCASSDKWYFMNKKATLQNRGLQRRHFADIFTPRIEFWSK